MNREYIEKFKRNYVTYSIVIINIIIYVACIFAGDYIRMQGSIGVIPILEWHQYYRFITCQFVHADLSHVLMNMVILIALGDILENEMSHFLFFITYLLSGISGIVISVVYKIFTGNLYYSLGASAAISGLIGALLVIVLAYNGRYKSISTTRIGFCIFYMIYSGTISAEVDNMGHIGGFIGGVIIMSVLCVTGIYRKRKYN